MTKKYVYSDFDINLSRNLETNDLLKLTDQEAIKNSIRNILYTNKGERLFQPNFGSDMKNYIYEQITMIKAEEIKAVIQEQLRRYEDRIFSLTVEVIPIPKLNLFKIDVNYRDSITEEPMDLTFNITVGK